MLSRKRLASCISHIKLCAVGTSSGVKYGCQLHRNMQMWAYTVEGREKGREMVVIYFPCVSVSFGRCELQFLHFPSAPFVLAIFSSRFLLFMTVFYFLLLLSIDLLITTGHNDLCQTAPKGRYSTIVKAYKYKPKKAVYTVATQSN